MSYKIQWEENGGVYVQFWGFVSKEELLRQSLEIIKHPRAQQLRYDIADFSGVTNYDASAYDVLFLAAKDFYIPYRYLAIISANQDVISMANVYVNSPLMAEREICIVASLPEARSWVAGRLAGEANKGFTP